MGAADSKWSSGWRSTHMVGLVVLLISTVFGSLGALFAKYALESFSPLTLTCLRVWIATIVMLPIALKLLPEGLHLKKLITLLPMSICYGLNITLFAIGIDYTTAIVSQTLYLLVPVIVLIGSRIFFSEQLTPIKLLGTSFGIIGVLLIIFGSTSHGLANSLGTPFGNSIILIAVFSWASFIMLARHQSQAHSPIELTCYALLTLSIVLPFFTLPELLSHSAIHAPVTGLSLISVVLFGLIVSVARDFTLQWGVRHTSAFAASATGFVSPFSATLYAIPLLGERISSTLLLSGILIILGIIFAVIIPARQHMNSVPVLEEIE